MVRKTLMLLALAVAGVVSQAHSQSPAPGDRPAATITVEQALVTLIDDVKVPATQLGMLMEIHVKEGQSVEKDQQLAAIDSRETEAKRRIAEGEFAAAEKQAQNTAEIDLAKTGIEVALAEYESYLEIRKRNPGAVSEAEIRKLYFQHQRAIAQEKVATNEHVIHQFTAQTKQAQLDATAIELDLRQIKSPFKGQVIEIFKKRGEWVQAGEPIMHVAGLEKMRVTGKVKASDAAPAEVIGKPVLITVKAGRKEHTVKATIGFASPIIHPVSGDFRVWAEVQNEHVLDPVTKIETWKIPPGSMATMTIDLSPPPPVRPMAPGKAEAVKAGPAGRVGLPASPALGAPGAASGLPPVTSGGPKSSSPGGRSSPPAHDAYKPVLTGPGGDSAAGEKSSSGSQGGSTHGAPIKAEPIRSEPSKAAVKPGTKEEPKSAPSSSKER